MYNNKYASKMFDQTKKFHRQSPNINKTNQLLRLQINY